MALGLVLGFVGAGMYTCMGVMGADWGLGDTGRLLLTKMRGVLYFSSLTFSPMRSTGYC